MGVTRAKMTRTGHRPPPWESGSMSTVRRGVFVLFVFLAALVVAPLTARAQTGTPVVVLDGRGFGHGVGLARGGAKYMADAGARHEDILSKFYLGTQLATDLGSGTIRVAVYTSSDNAATLSFPSGGEGRSPPPPRLPAGGGGRRPPLRRPGPGLSGPGGARGSRACHLRRLVPRHTTRV